MPTTPDEEDALVKEVMEAAQEVCDEVNCRRLQAALDAYRHEVCE